MNNYRVSVDLTISIGANSDLWLGDYTYEVAHKIIDAIGTDDSANIQINRISTDIINKLPLYAVPPVANIKKVEIEPDDDGDEFLEPEWNAFPDDEDDL